MKQRYKEYAFCNHPGLDTALQLINHIHFPNILYGKIRKTSTGYYVIKLICKGARKTIIISKEELSKDFLDCSMLMALKMEKAGIYKLLGN